MTQNGQPRVYRQYDFNGNLIIVDALTDQALLIIDPNNKTVTTAEGVDLAIGGNLVLEGGIDLTGADLTVNDLQVDGNLTVAGSIDLTGADLTGLGDIGAVNGTFSGDVGADNVTAAGDVGAVNGTFSGDLSAVNVTASGDLGAVNATFSGDLGVVAIAASGDVTLSGIPTADPLVAGQVWNDAGALKISAGPPPGP